MTVGTEGPGGVGKRGQQCCSFGWGQHTSMDAGGGVHKARGGAAAPQGTGWLRSIPACTLPTPIIQDSQFASTCDNVFT